jgi:hypothetical protein
MLLIEHHHCAYVCVALQRMLQKFRGELSEEHKLMCMNMCIIGKFKITVHLRNALPEFKYVVI